MNQYRDIAAQLLGQVGGGYTPAPQRDLRSIQAFLRTSSGRTALRGAVDRIVASHKMGTREPTRPVNDELFEILDFVSKQDMSNGYTGNLL